MFWIYKSEIHKRAICLWVAYHGSLLPCCRIYAFSGSTSGTNNYLLKQRYCQNPQPLNPYWTSWVCCGTSLGDSMQKKIWDKDLCGALPIFKEPPKEWILGFPERFMILDAKRPNRQTSDIDLDLALEIVWWLHFRFKFPLFQAHASPQYSSNRYCLPLSLLWQKHKGHGKIKNNMLSIQQ